MYLDGKNILILGGYRRLGLSASKLRDSEGQKGYTQLHNATSNDRKSLQLLKQVLTTTWHASWPSLLLPDLIHSTHIVTHVQVVCPQQIKTVNTKMIVMENTC